MADDDRLAWYTSGTTLRATPARLLPRSYDGRAFVPATARRVIVHGRRDVRFGGPVALELREPPRLSGGDAVHLRLEYRTSDKALRGHELLLVPWPWSLHIVVRLPFLTAHADRYETNAAYLTASFTEQEGAVLEPPRHWRCDGYAQGLVEDFEQARNALARTPEVAELAELTTSNRLKTHYPGAPDLLGQRDAATYLGYLDTAMRQALGGPIEEDASAWEGRPVGALVDRIYRRHVEAAVKRDARQDRRHVDP